MVDPQNFTLIAPTDGSTRLYRNCAKLWPQGVFAATAPNGGSTGFKYNCCNK